MELSTSQGTLHDLKREFELAEKESISFQSLYLFLNSRHLIPQAAADVHAGYFDLVAKAKLPDVMVKVLKTANENFKDSLERKLFMKEVVINALKQFSKDSDMFASRFDKFVGTSGHPNDFINTPTQKTLDDLEMLVSGADVRVEAFNHNLKGMLAELEGKGGRRQRKMEKELELIANFFSSGRTAMRRPDSLGQADRSTVLQDSLRRLNAAFKLIRYREVMLPFISALRELKLLTLAADLNSDNSVKCIYENFLVMDAEQILDDLQKTLCGLRLCDLKIIARIAPEKERTVFLLFEFLKKMDDRAFEGALERAQNRAQSNEHAGSVLMKLADIRKLLEPFWNPERRITNIDGLKKHLQLHVRLHDVENQEPVCVTLEELINVIENWVDTEILFRDGGDSFFNSDDIVRSIKEYQSAGFFMSSLSSHESGAALSFSYGKGDRRELGESLLQEHTQWAMLGGERKGEDADTQLLHEFVKSFKDAQKAHAIRLELENLGHPDFQTTENVILSSVLHCDITRILDTLHRLRAEWNEVIKEQCMRCPRLTFLNRRTRMRLLIALREPMRRRASSVFPYIIQCFAVPFPLRQFVLGKLTNLIADLGEPDTDNAVLGLQFTCNLLNRLNAILLENEDCKDYIRLNQTEACITRLDLFGNNGVDIYSSHLADMISSTDGLPALPGMVLFCKNSTKEVEVRDLLQLASQQICRTVHVVGVDQLVPRVREELLREIQRTRMGCPLMLIFGDQSGSDAFSQYLSPPPCALTSPNHYAGQAYWAHKKVHVDEIPNATVFVVCGESGNGKSLWIANQSARFSTLRFVVHEGFSATMVIERYLAEVQKFEQSNERNKICFHFDVTEFGDFKSLGLFFHFLFSIGLLYDDCTGLSCAIMPNINLSVYIELPAIFQQKSDDQDVIEWPPKGDRHWRCRNHPYMSLLPALVAVVPQENFKEIKHEEDFSIDSKASLVATYIFLDGQPGNDFSTYATLPIVAAENLIGDHHQCRIILVHFFNAFGVSESKRVRFNLISLLHERLLYLARLHKEAKSELDQGAFLRYDRLFSPGCFHKLLHLFIHESVGISSDSSVLKDTCVFSIRPAKEAWY